MGVAAAYESGARSQARIGRNVGALQLDLVFDRLHTGAFGPGFGPNPTEGRSGPTQGTVLPGNHEVAQRDHRASMNCTKAGAACETTRRRLDRIRASIHRPTLRQRKPKAVDRSEPKARQRKLADSLKKAAKPAKSKIKPELIDPERLSKAIRFIRDHPKQ
jgi:hypothetical protein